MFITTSEFVKTRLPELMQGKSPMRILMMTHHAAEGSHIPAGLPKGLEIDVVPPLRAQERNGAQYDLAIAYLGLDAFKKHLTVALHLKRSGRVPSLVVLTCDCTLADKEDWLRLSVANGAINHALSTTRCGGTYDLFQIADSASRIWMARVLEHQEESEAKA